MSRSKLISFVSYCLDTYTDRRTRSSGPTALHGYKAVKKLPACLPRVFDEGCLLWTSCLSWPVSAIHVLSINVCRDILIKISKIKFEILVNKVDAVFI